MSSQLPDVESLTVCKEIVQCCQPKPKMIVQVGLFAEEETINQFKESGVEVVLLRKEKDLHPLELAIEQLLNLTQWKTS